MRPWPRASPARSLPGFGTSGDVSITHTFPDGRDVVVNFYRPTFYNLKISVSIVPDRDLPR